MSKVMEQLSHPFMMIVITVMLVLLVIAGISALYEYFKPVQVKSQKDEITCFIKYEDYLRGLGNTDLRVLKDQYNNRLKTFMSAPERTDLLIRVDLIEHILHCR